MKFAAVLSALGLGPKTLPQAQDTLETAKATFEKIDALFVSAGLDLGKMLDAGADSLKAHIASVGAKDGDLAAAQATITELNGKLTAFTAMEQRVTAVSPLLTIIGAKADTKPEDFVGLLDKHVKQAAALELGKTGHAPVPVVVGSDAKPAAPGANASRTEHYEYMGTLPVGEQHAYFKKHLARQF